MGIEIERKFLVKNNNFKKDSYKKNYLKQGYLSSDKNRTVRIRITDSTAYITIKGASNSTGTTRFEWEKEILKTEAEDLLLLCKDIIIEKTRYLIKVDNYTFEVDEFYGANDGLIVAEVELNAENDVYRKPEWLGKEVTGDVKYYNSSISKHPYKDWK